MKTVLVIELSHESKEKMEDYINVLFNEFIDVFSEIEDVDKGLWATFYVQESEKGLTKNVPFKWSEFRFKK